MYLRRLWFIPLSIMVALCFFSSCSPDSPGSSATTPVSSGASNTTVPEDGASTSDGRSSYSLGIKVSPTNSGSVIMSEQRPGNTYPAGTAITLTAIANTGYEFVAWDGDIFVDPSGEAQPGKTGSDALEVVIFRDTTIYAIFRLVQPGGTLSDLEIINRASQTITVAAQGGDFDKLSDALSSIKDAAKDKRYAVLVVGNINDSNSIGAKSYVDVIGYAADITVTMDSTSGGLMVSDVTESTWRNVSITRAGTIDGNAHVARIYGNTTDSTFRLENCQFTNKVASTADGNVAIAIFNQARPMLVGCTAKAGPGNYSYAISITGESSPTLIQTVGIGGSYGYNCHGILSSQASHATMINCIGKQGTGGKTSYGLAIIDQASPVIIGCTGTFQTLDYYWPYQSAGQGRFSPFADKPYQVIGIYLLVKEAAPSGTTLKIGTRPGGAEISGPIPIDTTTYQYFDFNRQELKENEWLYATTSSAIKNDSIKIYYSVAPDYGPCSGMYLRTEGCPVISNCCFISNGSSSGLLIGSDVIATTNWRFSNCYFETLDRANQYAVEATVPVVISGSHLSNCTFVGATKNVTITGGD